MDTGDPKSIATRKENMRRANFSSSSKSNSTPTGGYKSLSIPHLCF